MLLLLGDTLYAEYFIDFGLVPEWGTPLGTIHPLSYSSHCPGENGELVYLSNAIEGIEMRIECLEDEEFITRAAASQLVYFDELLGFEGYQNILEETRVYAGLDDHEIAIDQWGGDLNEVIRKTLVDNFKQN
eukprot:UN33928